MKRLIRIALGASTLFLVACGGKPLDATKEAAAGAVFMASRGSGSTGVGLAELYNSGAAITTAVTVNCPRGGTLSLGIDIQTAMAYDLTYNNCNFDGQTSLSGSIHTAMSVDVGPPVAISQHLTGRVNFSGAVSDFVDVDISQVVVAGALNTPTPTVSITLNGSATTSSGTYVFANETIVIDGSHLTTSP